METIIKVKTCPRCGGKKRVKIDGNTYKCFACCGSGKALIRKTTVTTVEPL